MIDFKIDKINSLKMRDINTLEPIVEFNDTSNVTIESYIEPSSLSKEVLSFNYEASFEGELTDCSSLLNYTTNFNDKPLYVEYYIPIMIQARWHKKRRTNKKWLKRYGMKKDKVLVRCNIDFISPDNSYDDFDLIESKGYNIGFSNMQHQLRPEQKRRNLKIELDYE